jgi:hypothetical protein
MVEICFECGVNAEENHHVIPLSMGGTKTIPLCNICHGKVHDIKRLRLSELTKAGLKKAKERGVKLGTKSGFPKGVQHLGVEVIKDNAKQFNTGLLDIICSELSKGKTYQQISEYLNSTKINGSYIKTRRGGEWTAQNVGRLAKQCKISPVGNSQKGI